jgi:hypothetical protein
MATAPPWTDVAPVETPVDNRPPRSMAYQVLAQASQHLAQSITLLDQVKEMGWQNMESTPAAAIRILSEATRASKVGYFKSVAAQGLMVPEDERDG